MKNNRKLRNKPKQVQSTNIQVSWQEDAIQMWWIFNKFRCEPMMFLMSFTLSEEWIVEWVKAVGGGKGGGTEIGV